MAAIDPYLPHAAQGHPSQYAGTFQSSEIRNAYLHQPINTMTTFQSVSTKKNHSKPNSPKIVPAKAHSNLPKKPQSAKRKTKASEARQRDRSAPSEKSVDHAQALVGSHASVIAKSNFAALNQIHKSYKENLISAADLQKE
jgi:hypothetical protein